MSGRLEGKVRRIETACGGRRFPREKLSTRAARFAHDLGKILDSAEASDFASAEQRARVKLDIDRALLADVSLSSGNAGALAPVYCEEIAAWDERQDSLVKGLVYQALATEGLADWCSEKRDWVGPGGGDPTGETPFTIERRWQRALELVEVWLGSAEGIKQMLEAAKAAHELTEQKRRECSNDLWRRLSQLAREGDESE